MTTPANNLGYFAAQSVNHVIRSIRVASKSLDLETCTEEEILDALDIINRASWEAKNSIERDIAERSTTPGGSDGDQLA